MASVVVEDSSAAVFDAAYEFAAPGFFDFINGESEDDVIKAELWFETALSYAPSPLMPRIKTDRNVRIEGLCDFTEADQAQKSTEPSGSTAITSSPSKFQPKSVLLSTEIGDDRNGVVNEVVVAKSCDIEEEKIRPQENTREKINRAIDSKKISTVGLEVCTPKPPTISTKGGLIDSKKRQSAKKIASLVKNPSALKLRNQPQISQSNVIKPSSEARNTNVKKVGTTANFVHENQAIKRQKLEGGKTRSIISVAKPQMLTHKSRPGSTSSFCPSTAKGDRKMYAREPAAPFISMAEMIKKFQSNTREISLSRMNSSLSHDDAASSILRSKPRLKLTKPKQPEFETAQRVRPVTMKSSAELEEEMMAKIPKFKARPVNKKILEAPTLLSLPRSTPQLPEFQEFHLETTARANQNAETSTIASAESSHQNPRGRPCTSLAEHKTPFLQTSLRARPPKVKSTAELEQEELEKAPKFKARPLNRKIFESKGDLGIFCNSKRHVTIPQEFHFATDERVPPAATVTDLFDKLSLKSEAGHENQIVRNTMPNPFHLHTEERGEEKERKLLKELMQKQLEEESARVPKATPYPYTTDFPVIPSKPEPKQSTKPEPFQLESLVRHEEEMQREMQERERMEKQEAQMRIFKAQPILTEDPIPVPEKVRRPLTQVENFNLKVDTRAVERAEFDRKVKEKELVYKRYREESESSKMIEEEKALKQLRRTMVPHARPVPKFDHPFLPQKSTKETTKAKSPNLRILRRRERRRMVDTFAVTSSPAANMR